MGPRTLWSWCSGRSPVIRWSCSLRPLEPGVFRSLTPSLTFDSTNWSVPQVFVLTGEDDDLIDGAQQATLIVSVDAATSDDDFDTVAPASVLVTTSDDDVAAIAILESAGGTVVSEDGTGVDAFVVSLSARPATNVVLNVSSSDLGEVAVTPNQLTFTPTDWDSAQPISVNGVDDLFDDGDLDVPVVLTIDPDASDDDFDSAPSDTVIVENLDDDTAGLTVTQSENLSVVGEAGLQDTLTVLLEAKPIDPVTVTILSSDTLEVRGSPSLLTFTTANWNVAQTVVISGQDDTTADGNKPALIAIGVSEGLSDPSFANVSDETVLVTNLDNDRVSVSVTPTGGLRTTEAGSTQTFDVVLNAQPSADVIIPVVSGDPTEGEVDQSSLSFTPSDWNTPQTVTVTGQEDDLDDGDVPYPIFIGPVVSTDVGYDGLDPSDVNVVNEDDDRAGISVSPTAGLETTEAGGEAQFSVVLDSEPTADVVIAVASSDEAEGTVDQASLTFTASDWNTPQIVTIVGVDDDFDEADRTPFSVLLAPATSPDDVYSGLDPTDVSVVNFDDDGLGVSLTPTTGLQTTESGGTALFSIELGSQPTADVLITLTSDDPSEGTVPPSVTFTPIDWATPQTVTITGQPDDFDDGDIDYLIQTAAVASADLNYDGLELPDVSVRNVDDDDAQFTVGAISGSVDEAGATTANFTVELGAQPAPGTQVVVLVSVEDGTELSAAPSSFTFLPGDWTDVRTVTVTGQDDPLIDGDQSTLVVLTIDDPNSDPAFGLLPNESVAVTNLDDEVAGFTIVNPGAKTVNEAGTVTETFGLVLDAQPEGSVRLDITSQDEEEATTSPDVVTFQPGAWDVEQIITIQGVDDSEIDGPQTFNIVVSVDQSASDALFVGVTDQTVEVTNTDNDLAALIVNEFGSVSVSEFGTTDVFEVALTSAPASNVVLTIVSQDEAAALVTPGLTLTFTPGTWNTPQEVEVTGVDDDIVNVVDRVTDVIISVDNAASDDDFDDVSETVSVTTTDNDQAGITTVSVGPVELTEDGSAVFAVRLDTEPASDVVLSVTSDDIGEVTVSAAGLPADSLTFTPADWDTDQIVTLNGVLDGIVDDDQLKNITVTLDPDRSDDTYDLVAQEIIPATVQDVDIPNFLLTGTENLTTAEDGTQDTFFAVLTAEPVGQVSLEVTSDDPSEISVVSTPLFTAANWDLPQPIVLAGVNDDIDDGDIQTFVTVGVSAGSDPLWGVVADSVVDVTNEDDLDTADFTVSTISGNTSESGATATFTVVLDSEPTASVTVDVASNDATEGLVTDPALGTLTFTTGNWDTPQTVTVTGQDDDIDDGAVAYSIVLDNVASTDGNYSVLDPADVSVTNDNDDTADFTVSTISGNTSESGATATFTVVLDSEPTASVTVDVASNDATEGLVTDPALGTLTFTTANWDTPQTVTVTGQDDDIDDGAVAYSIVLDNVASTDGNYSVLDPADVSVTNDNDDTADFTVSTISGNTSESGATATFTVVLDSEPTASVTVDVASNDATEGLVTDPALGTLTFTTANWDTPQTVTVTGQDDDIDDGAVAYSIVLDNVASTDGNYSVLDPADVSVTNDNDDTADFTVSTISSNTSESGATATFTVVLDSEPTASVTVDVASNDATEGLVTDPALGTLTFTTANWDTPQTVTVTGQDDDIDDGAVAYSIVLDNVASTDGNYSVLDPADVSVTNDNDDTADFTVSTISSNTSESGATATFTVVLDSEPTASVTVDVASNDATEGLVTDPALGTLTFTTANWDTPQTVTVTGQDDDIDDGAVAYSIVLDNVASTDGNYSVLDPADVSVTNDNDDTADFTVSTISSNTSESGATATFTVVLDSEPTASVTVDVASNDATEGLVTDPALGTLTFTTGTGTRHRRSP